MELPKILMLYRASPHQISGKSTSKLLINRELRTKLPYIEFNSDSALSALDREHRSKCDLYQARLKDFHDSKQHAEPHDFKIGDIVFCANIRPKKLDSTFSPAKHVIIETKARDTFSLVNVDTGTTSTRNAKFLKHAPSKHISNDIDVDTSVKSKESNDPSAKTITELSSKVVEQNSQSDQVITTRSGRVVKSTRDCDNFVYY